MAPSITPRLIEIERLAGPSVPRFTAHLGCGLAPCTSSGAEDRDGCAAQLVAQGALNTNGGMLSRSNLAPSCRSVPTAIALDPSSVPAHNARAWLRATCPDPKYRDGKQAVESATRACELSTWKSPGELDTLAAAYAEAGDFDAAVKWEEEALKMHTDEEHRSGYRARLALYRARTPYREEANSR